MHPVLCSVLTRPSHSTETLFKNLYFFLPRFWYLRASCELWNFVFSNKVQNQFYAIIKNHIVLQKFSTNITIKIIKSLPVLLTRSFRSPEANKTGNDLIILYIYFRGKLFIIRCDK